VDGFREERDLIKGIIVWEGFKKIDYLERSKMVDEKVRDPLGLRGLNVDIIYTLAPKEKL